MLVGLYNEMIKTEKDLLIYFNTNIIVFLKKFNLSDILMKAFNDTIKYLNSSAVQLKDLIIKLLNQKIQACLFYIRTLPNVIKNQKLQLKVIQELQIYYID